jgi:hypothetical protein
MWCSVERRDVDKTGASHALWGYLEPHGRAQAVYTDKASLFQPPWHRGIQQIQPAFVVKQLE